MTDVIAEQGAMIDGVANKSATASRLGGAGHLKNAIAKAIADGTASATASRLGAQGRIYAIAGGGNISPNLPGGTVWSPSALFASSEVGVWYDPSDLSTMFQNSDGTTAVAVGDPVGYIADKSGNGFHATQANAASRPVLRQTVGGLYYLEFDGTDDFLVTSAIDFTATDEMSVFSGVYRVNDVPFCLIELSADINANAGAFAHLLGVDVRDYYAVARGSAAVLASQASTITQAGPDLAVFSGLHDISADISICRRNGTAATAGTGDKGTGNFGNYALYIGRRGGASLSLNGHIYSVIVRGKTSDATEISNAEAYVNGKTGAF